MLAQLFVTMLTGNASVRRLGKAFGVAAVVPFPANQDRQRKCDEAIRIWVRNEDQRCEHHCEIPIVDSAIGTASVFHKPRLERAEKEDADHIANTVCEGDEDQNSRIYYIREIKDSDYSVECKPSRRNGEGALPRLKARSFLRGWDKISCELLLTTGTFEF